MMRVIAYLRVSTSEQAASGLGLDAQQTVIAAAAVRLSLVVVATFTDAGVSGSRGIDRRPGLADALNALQRGDTLLIAKRDRLARDTFVSILVEREVQRKRARIVSASGEGSDGDDPTSTFTRRILDAVSELERALIASRTRAAMAEAKKRGQRVGHVPFGHRVGADGRLLEVHPDEHAILEAMRACRQQGWGPHRIAQALTAQGWRTRQGGPFKRPFVQQLLRRHVDPLRHGVADARIPCEAR